MEVILSQKHKLKGREIDVNKAVEKEETESFKMQNYARKLFVDNLSKRISDGKILRSAKKFIFLKNFV